MAAAAVAAIVVVVAIVISFLIVGMVFQVAWFILRWLVFGFIVGWLAHKVLGRSGGFWEDVIIGICGSFIGALLGEIIPALHGGRLREWLAAFVGACILLALQRLLLAPRRA